MTVEEGFLSWLNHLEHLWVKEKSSVQIPDFSLTGREKTPVSLGAAELPASQQSQISTSPRLARGCWEAFS